jgi:hypothetical protein
MGKSYRRYFPDEELLLPPSLRDWLPENHLAYFVSDVVRHYLLHEAIKGSDPILGLATAKDSGAMYVQRSHIGPGTATEIFVFDAHGGARSASPRGVLAPTRLDAGLLVR